jgi:hypothetical protein
VGSNPAAPTNKIKDLPATQKLRKSENRKIGASLGPIAETAEWWHFAAMLKPPLVNLRLKCSLELYERISTYRHEARHDSKNQALVALISAGLAAMTKPVTLPPTTRSKPIPFAGR